MKFMLIAHAEPKSGRPRNVTKTEMTPRQAARFRREMERGNVEGAFAPVINRVNAAERRANRRANSGGNR